MKKLAVLIVCAAVMASCDSFSGGSKNQLKAENDSLLMELTQRNAELDEMMGTFNDISLTGSRLTWSGWTAIPNIPRGLSSRLNTFKNA